MIEWIAWAFITLFCSLPQLCIDERTRWIEEKLQCYHICIIDEGLCEGMTEDYPTCNFHCRQRSQRCYDKCDRIFGDFKSIEAREFEEKYR